MDAAYVDSVVEIDFSIVPSATCVYLWNYKMVTRLAFYRPDEYKTRVLLYEWKIKGEKKIAPKHAIDIILLIVYSIFFLLLRRNGKFNVFIRL